MVCSLRNIVTQDSFDQFMKRVDAVEKLTRDHYTYRHSHLLGSASRRSEVQGSNPDVDVNEKVMIEINQPCTTGIVDIINSKVDDVVE